jgi:hypothetical protein
MRRYAIRMPTYREAWSVIRIRADGGRRIRNAVLDVRVHQPRAEFQMKRSLPRTPAQWLKEIKLAITDAAGAAPFGPLVGTEITAANLFHLAPVVYLKFRGKKLKGREADRVTKVALANYVVNSDPQGVDHGLEQRPLMAFTLCYVAAHLALELINEQEAEAVLNYCEDHL